MTMKNNILKNKWFIFIKLLIPSILLLFSIFTLLTAWRTSQALSTWKATSSSEIVPILTNSEIDTLNMWKSLALSFAIIGMILVLFGFGINKNAIFVYSIMTILLIFIAIILAISILCIMKSNTLLINQMPNNNIFPN